MSLKWAMMMFSALNPVLMSKTMIMIMRRRKLRIKEMSLKKHVDISRPEHDRVFITATTMRRHQGRGFRQKRHQLVQRHRSGDLREIVEVIGQITMKQDNVDQTKDTGTTFYHDKNFNHDNFLIICWILCLELKNQIILK